MQSGFSDPLIIIAVRGGKDNTINLLMKHHRFAANNKNNYNNYKIAALKLA